MSRLVELVNERVKGHSRLDNAAARSGQLASRQASVLVPLSLRARASNEPRGDADGRIWVLLTVRAATLSSHAGEVALPGGRTKTARGKGRERGGSRGKREARTGRRCAWIGRAE